MRFRTFKNTELAVSEVGFGLWTISTGWWGSFTEGEAIALMGGLLELRHVGKLNTRVIWFFMKSRRIVAVHGIRNKGQAIAGRDPDTARERMRDGKGRHE